MTETLIGTPARNYVGGEWRPAYLRQYRDALDAPGAQPP